MEFNIKKILQQKQQQTPEWKDKKTCYQVLLGYVPSISISDITIRKGILILEKIQPHHRTKIKLQKKYILELINKKGVYLRDIL